MAKASKSVVPSYQLRAIELHELTINKPAPGSKPPANFNFDIRMEATVDKPQNLVINNATIKIKSGNNSEVLGSITCACIFSVANFDEVVTMKSETEAEINETFAEELNAISISTTRGVMFSEMKGTFLHYAFLPIIDIQALLKQKAK
jgi:hypothetical protein